MYNPCKLIEDAQTLFAIKPIEDAYGWRGLLLPPRDGSIYDYGRPAVHLELSVYGSNNDQIDMHNPMAFCAIRSIDDSGVSIFGPRETYDKAKARLDNLKERLEDFYPWCPNKETLEKICLEVGMHPDYW